MIKGKGAVAILEIFLCFKINPFAQVITEIQQLMQLAFVEAAGFVVVLRLCLPFALLGGEDFFFI